VSTCGELNQHFRNTVPVHVAEHFVRP
jgi:hypothetical protein